MFLKKMARFFELYFPVFVDLRPVLGATEKKYFLFSVEELISKLKE